MSKNYGLKICETAALLALCISLCAAAWAQGRQENIQENILRLHVLAVSDEENEQQLKLRVKDSVMACLESILEGAENSAEAEEIITDNLQSIAEAAFSASEGRQVSVSLGEESYSSREHGGIRLPAGRYKSLKVVLGEGKGQNWWCVVFPQLCLEAGDAAAEGNLAEREFKIVSDSETYEIRFKLLELWGSLISAIEQ